MHMNKGRGKVQLTYLLSKRPVIIGGRKYINVQYTSLQHVDDVYYNFMFQHDSICRDKYRKIYK